MLVLVLTGASALIVGVVIGVVLQKANNKSKMLNYMQPTREMQKYTSGRPSKNFGSDIRLNELVEAFPELKDTTTVRLRPCRIAFKDLCGNAITPESVQIEDASNGELILYFMIQVL